MKCLPSSLAGWLHVEHSMTTDGKYSRWWQLLIGSEWNIIRRLTGEVRKRAGRATFREVKCVYSIPARCPPLKIANTYRMVIVRSSATHDIHSPEVTYTFEVEFKVFWGCKGMMSSTAAGRRGHGMNYSMWNKSLHTCSFSCTPFGSDNENTRHMEGLRSPLKFKIWH